MYTIVQTSGKQFLFKPGQWYDLDLIKNVNLGDFIYLNKILFFKKANKVQIGQPFLTKRQIVAKIIQKKNIHVLKGIVNLIHVLVLKI